MQVVDLAMSLALGMIQLRAFESGWIARIGEPFLHFRSGQTGELREKLRAAPADLLVEAGIVIGEEQKRAGRAELLPLKEHRRTGREQHKSGHRTKFSRRS